MNAVPAPLQRKFAPIAPDASGAVSWIHLGDLHMVRRGEQNFVDFQRIVREINERYAGNGVSFVYLPGDVADDGSRGAYEAVLECLSELQLPWTAVVGDHDVHEGSFANLEWATGEALWGAFTVGNVRFLRLNTFSDPRPDSFSVDCEQLDWIERELEACASASQHAVVLMHCYPSDLKQGGARLTELLRKYRVLLVDMGHTHYNEISNDGTVLYSATRSTGQIEEGPVGYSVVTVDGDAVSWQFVQPEEKGLVAITRPRDERLVTDLDQSYVPGTEVLIRARVWAEDDVSGMWAECGNARAALVKQPQGNMWQGSVALADVPEGVHLLSVVAEVGASTVRDDVRLVIGPRRQAPVRRERDQDNAVGAWPERGILGTQLGPNKNGRKW